MKKIAIITGGAKQGIGEAITRMLTQNHEIILTYEIEEKPKALEIKKEFPGIEMYEVDNSNFKSLESFVDKVKDKEIDVIVNASMFFHLEKGEVFDPDLFQKGVNVNLVAPNFLIRSLSASLKDGASVVIITSTEGFIGSFGSAAYAASKAAIHNLTKTLANLFGEKNVRVNSIAPGWIGGVMDTDEVFNQSRQITPLKRLGSPEEVANVVEFLVSSKSSFINGTTIVVDGGYSGVDTISKYEYLA